MINLDLDTLSNNLSTMSEPHMRTLYGQLMDALKSTNSTHNRNAHLTKQVLSTASSQNTTVYEINRLAKTTSKATYQRTSLIVAIAQVKNTYQSRFGKELTSIAMLLTIGTAIYTFLNLSKFFNASNSPQIKL